MPKKIQQISQFLLLVVTAALCSASATADEKIFTNFGEYRVQHTVFNSSFIKPEIASIYNLTRGKDHALVNIAVLKNSAGGKSKGLPAKVSGSVANLMQQAKPLDFKEIKEQDATYYLADLRFDNEEVLHFNITVTVDGRDLDVKFSKKLYVE